MSESVSIKSLCARLEIGRTKAHKLLSEGELDGYKVGSATRIMVDSVDRYISRNRIHPTKSVRAADAMASGESR